MSGRKSRPWRARVAALLLMAYIAASQGLVPFPHRAWHGQKARADERYPCEDCGCGCASATECWAHCCCHSAHERLVWALENGVMPPPAVHFTDAQWIAAAESVQPGCATCTRCVEHLKRQLRQGVPFGLAGRRALAGGSQCTGHCGGIQPHLVAQAKTDVAAADPVAQRVPGGHSTTPGRRGLAVTALACKGLSPLVTLTLPPTPPAQAVVLTILRQICFENVCPHNATCSSRILEVALPPPRSRTTPI